MIRLIFRWKSHGLWDIGSLSLCLTLLQVNQVMPAHNFRLHDTQQRFRVYYNPSPYYKERLKELISPPGYRWGPSRIPHRSRCSLLFHWKYVYKLVNDLSIFRTAIFICPVFSFRTRGTLSFSRVVGIIHRLIFGASLSCFIPSFSWFIFVELLVYRTFYL